mmetsp:Transcript_2215/g.5247  ORF Transcript_2215/g.5247 Transcript_2215/m.5247 type:complete len:743 (+) Transcript_2215:195-2423(+)
MALLLQPEVPTASARTHNITPRASNDPISSSSNSSCNVRGLLSLTYQEQIADNQALSKVCAGYSNVSTGSGNRLELVPIDSLSRQHSISSTKTGTASATGGGSSSGSSSATTSGGRTFGACSPRSEEQARTAGAAAESSLSRTRSRTSSKSGDATMVACLQGVLQWWGCILCLDEDYSSPSAKRGILGTRSGGTAKPGGQKSPRTGGVGGLSSLFQQNDSSYNDGKALSESVYPPSQAGAGFAGRVLFPRSGASKDSVSGMFTADEDSSAEQHTAGSRGTMGRSPSGGGFWTCDSEGDTFSATTSRRTNPLGGAGGGAASSGNNKMNSTPLVLDRDRKPEHAYVKNLESVCMQKKNSGDELMFEKLLQIYDKEFGGARELQAPGGKRGIDESLAWQFVFGYTKERNRTLVTEKCFRMALEERRRLGLLGAASTYVPPNETSQTSHPSASSPSSSSRRGTPILAEERTSSPLKDLTDAEHTTSNPKNRSISTSPLHVMRPASVARARISSNELRFIDYPVLQLGYESNYGYPVLWHLLDLRGVGEHGLALLEPLLAKEYCITENIRRLNHRLHEMGTSAGPRDLPLREAGVDESGAVVVPGVDEPRSGPPPLYSRGTSNSLQYKNVVIFDMATTFGNDNNNIQKKVNFFAQFVKRYEYFSPDSAHKIYLINCPLVFRMVWKGFSVFLSPVTREKINLLGSKEYVKSLQKDGINLILNAENRKRAVDYGRLSVVQMTPKARAGR